ncbi:CLUMA_CG018393, isoform A [Clunio marinus]|uniref:CLUMA_CG018393, isoform A n=1 Tax=Clunio marinus TaxID=568069 RepID=A0A1J1J0H7_9DIPT|nr:CLUMA_CG018393, isoform A [Clunio marinus]
MTEYFMILLLLWQIRQREQTHIFPGWQLNSSAVRVSDCSFGKDINNCYDKIYTNFVIKNSKQNFLLLFWLMLFSSGVSKDE